MFSQQLYIRPSPSLWQTVSGITQSSPPLSFHILVRFPSLLAWQDLWLTFNQQNKAKVRGCALPDESPHETVTSSCEQILLLHSFVWLVMCTTTLDSTTQQGTTEAVSLEEVDLPTPQELGRAPPCLNLQLKTQLMGIMMAALTDTLRHNLRLRCAKIHDHRKYEIGPGETAGQAWAPEFKPQNPCKKHGCTHTCDHSAVRDRDRRATGTYRLQA